MASVAISQFSARPRPLPTPDIHAIRSNSGSGGTPARSETTSSASSSYPPTMASVGDETLGQSMLGLSLQASPPSRERSLSPSPSSLQNGSPALTAPLPTLSSLQTDSTSVLLTNASPKKQVKWIRDVLFLVNRTCSPSAAVSADPQVGPLNIDDPALEQLAETALDLLLVVVPSVPPAGTKLAPPIAEALYFRASLTQSGAFPSHLPENPRKAFRAFEASARAGHYASWFKLGRCYEAFDDSKRAKECFERGAKQDDVSCLYRLGMAHLMGQLGLDVSPTTAVPLLFRAAERASIAVPQPAYVYGSLLLGDFAHTSAVLPSSVFLPYLPAGSTIEQEAQRFIDRAAYLHFIPAQYKLGHFYEFAREPYAYDPLLSVQYYMLASDTEPEACLALSKWFLCGAEGFFEKDELLARTFADRAARAGLPSAEFAMGYYWEVGIGSAPDMQRARKWYEKAAAHGNTDAADRLASLAQDKMGSLSRQDHDKLAEQTLVRRRTQAKQRSDAAGSIRRPGAHDNAAQVVDLVRKASKIQPRTRRATRKSQGPESELNVVNADSTRTGRRKSTGLQDIDESPQRAQSETLPPSTLAPPSQFQERKRYSLVDTGPSSRPVSPLAQPLDHNGPGGTQTPPRRYASPSPAPTSRTGSEVGSSSLSNVLSDSPIPSPRLDAFTPSGLAENAPRRARYNTFAEMGIQVSKIEEKECVIM